MVYGSYMQTQCNLQRNVWQCQKCSIMMLRASFSTEAGAVESDATGDSCLLFGFEWFDFFPF